MQQHRPRASSTAIYLQEVRPVGGGWPPALRFIPPYPPCSWLSRARLGAQAGSWAPKVQILGSVQLSSTSGLLLARMRSKHMDVYTTCGRAAHWHYVPIDAEALPI